MVEGTPAHFRTMTPTVSVQASPQYEMPQTEEETCWWTCSPSLPVC